MQNYATFKQKSLGRTHPKVTLEPKPENTGSTGFDFPKRKPYDLQLGEAVYSNSNQFKV